MTYRYRNLKTKETITTSNKISGQNWELIEDNPQVPAMEEAPEEETPEGETPEEETPEEETPAAPARTTRRGKK